MALSSVMPLRSEPEHWIRALEARYGFAITAWNEPLDTSLQFRCRCTTCNVKSELSLQQGLFADVVGDVAQHLQNHKCQLELGPAGRVK